MATRDYVLLEAITLGEGESKYTLCPECGREGKFSITNNGSGLLYNCFRDACNAQGFIPADGVTYTQRETTAPVKLNPYKKTIIPLKAWQYCRFLVNNGLFTRDIDARGRWRYAPEDNRYAFPIKAPQGNIRGYALRSYSGATPKSLTYMHEAGPKLSWYWCPNPSDQRIVLVEDQVSAVKVSRYAHCVALLGTSISPEAATEIFKHKGKCHVQIALDEDAINTAYKLNRDYGLLLDSSVVHLRKDLKDMSYTQIREKLNLC